MKIVPQIRSVDKNEFKDNLIEIFFTQIFFRPKKYYKNTKIN